MPMTARRGFTLIEVLAVIGIVGVLTSMLLPSLAGAREAARQARCMGNQRQLVLAWTMYAHEWRDAAMPLADERTPPEIRYWWGSIRAGAGPQAVREDRGYLMPYLSSGLHARSLLECPSQPWGSYRAQPTALRPEQPTSTYGYNGYFLAPASTPGWNQTIGGQRWQRLGDVPRPSELFVFADAMLAGSPMRNTALLDPPLLLTSGGSGASWATNPMPTTSFRHGATDAASTVTARADGSARAVAAQRAWLTHVAERVGSVWAGPTVDNGPHYIQTWMSSVGR
jgi:prepilin-type N-terminal cleavage/methylation domain-containing protein